jgi:hypothetical protein
MEKKRKGIRDVLKWIPIFGIFFFKQREEHAHNDEYDYIIHHGILSAVTSVVLLILRILNGPIV